MRFEPVPPAPFRDRTARLQFFGVLSILCGAAWILIGLLSVVLVLVGPEALAPDVPSTVTSLATHLLLGAVLIGTGIGSMRKRRWVRPIMLTIAWTWLIGGLLTLLLFVPLLDDLLVLAGSGGSPLPPTTALLLKLVLTATVVACGVLLPAVYVWAYRDEDVARTCEAASPTPAWTERCPLTVLGLSLALGATAVLGLLLVFRPVVPWFGRLLTGRSAALVLVLAAAVAFVLARSTFRLRMAGWWSTTLLLLLLGASVAVTFLRVEPSEYYRELGLPEEQVELLDHPWIGRMLVGGTVVLTVLSLGYMAAIRRHFLGAPRRTGA